MEELRLLVTFAWWTGTGTAGVRSVTAKLLAVEVDAAVVWTLSRALARQYQVPMGNVCVQLVPACHVELYAIVVKLEELLTSTWYCTASPSGAFTALQPKVTLAVDPLPIT